MDYLLSLSDDNQQHMVIFTLPENIVRHNAIDVVIDVIGDENIDELVAKNLVAEGYVDDLRALQRMIFDKDQQGIFIRESISFTANNVELNPDAPLMQAFAPAMRDGVKYFRSDIAVIDGASGSSSSSTGGASAGTNNNPKEFSDTFFLHQICVGRQLDVTKEPHRVGRNTETS